MSGRDSSRRRERIAFGRPIDWENEGRLGTIFFGPEKGDQFPPLPIGNVRDLFEEGYLDGDARHNEAPPAEDLVKWAEMIRDKYSSTQLEIGLIGYMVGPVREDSRVRLTGVSIRSPGSLPRQLKHDVASRFDPDLLSVNDVHIDLLWD